MFFDGVFGCEQDVTYTGAYGSYTNHEKPSTELRIGECKDSIISAAFGIGLYFIVKRMKKSK